MRKYASTLLVGLLVATSLSGCDGIMTNIAAGSTIRVIRRAAPAMSRLEDPDFAEQAIPGGLGTMEGVLVIKPEDADLHASLARGYASLGFAFYLDHMEAALANDDEEAAEHWRGRATMAFRRARSLGLEMLTIWEDDNGGAEGAINGGIDTWNAYLQNFDADQAPMLFWTAYAWANFINANRDDIDAIAGLPFVNAMVDRVLALDDTFYSYAPHALRAGLMGGLPAQLGGRPQDAKREFEIAIAATQRHNLMYLTMEARIVAVALQDRALYQSLLEEVINAGNVDPDNLLANQCAKRRAARYLADIDNLFEPVDAPAEEAPADAPVETPAAEAPAN
jgi:hypothetical protein